MARGDAAEFAVGEAAEFIGQAIARGIEERQGLERKVGDGNFGDLVGIVVASLEFDLARVADGVIALLQRQAEIAIAGIGRDMGVEGTSPG